MLETRCCYQACVLFDGELGNVHCFHPDFIDRIKNVGLKLEFNVKVGENLRPAAIAELDWQADPNCFLIQNILDTYAAQVKATQDKVCCIIAVLIVFPLLTMLQPLIMPPSNIVVGSKHLSRTQSPPTFALLWKLMMKTMMVIVWYSSFVSFRNYLLLLGKC